MSVMWRMGKGAHAKTRKREGFWRGNLWETFFFFRPRCFAAWREITDPISRRGRSNKRLSVICVGITRSAQNMD
jgi:hypothetical protein